MKNNQDKGAWKMKTAEKKINFDAWIVNNHHNLSDGTQWLLLKQNDDGEIEHFKGGIQISNIESGKIVKVFQYDHFKDAKKAYDKMVDAWWQ